MAHRYVQDAVELEKINIKYVWGVTEEILFRSGDEPGITRKVKRGLPGNIEEQQEITLIKGGQRSVYMVVYDELRLLDFILKTTESH